MCLPLSKFNYKVLEDLLYNLVWVFLPDHVQRYSGHHLREISVGARYCHRQVPLDLNAEAVCADHQRNPEFEAGS